MSILFWLAGIALVLILAAGGCETEELVVPSPVVTPVPFSTATAAPTQPPNERKAAAELKYLLIAHFGGVFFCDPDYYPVPRPDGEQQRAKEMFPRIQTDQELYGAILRHLGLARNTSFSDDQKLRVYQQYKQLNSVELEPAEGVSKFRLRTQEAKGEGFVVEGEIASSGQIKVLKREPTITTCPICLSEDTHIDTPTGPMSITELRVGMIVWTLDSAGARLTTPLLAVGSTPAPPGHEVIILRLADGRELAASPAHPVAGGRAVGSLVPGEVLGGSRLLSVNRELYEEAATYDILPGGATGLYWANGILMKSTLAR